MRLNNSGLIVLNLVLLFLLAGCGLFNPALPQDMCFLDIRVVGEGEVSPSGGEFAQGAVIDIWVEAAEGWVFSSWAGEHAEKVKEEEGQWKLVIEGAMEIEAVFVPKDYASLSGFVSIKHSFSTPLPDKSSFMRAEARETSQLAHPGEYGEEVIISLQRDVPEEKAHKILAKIGGKVTDRLPLLNAYLLEVPQVGVQDAGNRAFAFKEEVQ